MLRTRITRITGAMAMAMAIGTFALAGTASAAPLTDVGPICSSTGLSGFGNNWNMGCPQLHGTLDWDQPVAGGPTTPRLTGNLYINSNGTQARMQLVEYDDIWHSNLIATKPGTIRQGGMGLSVFAVGLGNATGSIEHVHVQLLEKDAAGIFQEVGERICNLGAAACT